MSIAEGLDLSRYGPGGALISSLTFSGEASTNLSVQSLVLTTMVELHGNNSPGFQSKDGATYKTYDQMRLANMRYNERRLKAKGLDSLPTLSSLLHHEIKVKAQAKTRRNNAKITPEPRRSPRIRKEPPAYEPLDDDDHELFKRARSTQKYSRKKHRRSKVKPDCLSDSERQALRQRVDWIVDMDEYLDHVQNISDANRRSVMRQVEKLASGKGITYQRWEEGTYFAAGRTITLGENFQTLFDEASAFEDNHGKDLGNGWLLRHPIKKMEDYQLFLKMKDNSQTKVLQNID